MTDRRKPPCLYPLSDGARCCECSTCHSYSFPPDVQRDDAIQALYAAREEVDSLRRDMLMCADKLEMRGNDEPRAVAKVLRGEA